MSRNLPVDPSLRFVQLEAKDILKAHKNGDASVCEVYRLMRRFSGHTDQELLQRRISLQETQLALALDYGFNNWQELKEHVEKGGGKQRGKQNEAVPEERGEPRYCWLCGRRRHDVDILIAGPKDCVCYECIGICERLISEVGRSSYVDEKLAFSFWLISEEDVIPWDERRISCSFCGKRRMNEKMELVVGQTAHICDGCVNLCSRISQEQIRSRGSKEAPYKALKSDMFRDRGKEQERKLILEALEESGGVRPRAARLLKITDTALVEKIREHDIALANPDPPYHA